MSPVNGQSKNRFSELLNEQTTFITSQYSGIERELEGIKGTLSEYHTHQANYHAKMEEIHHDIHRSIKKFNVGLRLANRIMAGWGEKMYRLIVLLILLLAGVKAIEFLNQVKL
jgi:hypothetical protein